MSNILLQIKSLKVFQLIRVLILAIKRVFFFQFPPLFSPVKTITWIYILFNDFSGFFFLAFLEKPCDKVCCARDGVAGSTGQANSDFSHPVYKEIAVTNGHINRMSQNELRKKLAELQLDTR